jgi:hypothetical protein
MRPRFGPAGGTWAARRGGIDIPTQAPFVEAARGFFPAPGGMAKDRDFRGLQGQPASERGERPITTSRCTLTPMRIPKPISSVSIEVPP